MGLAPIKTCVVRSSDKHTELLMLWTIDAHHHQSSNEVMIIMHQQLSLLIITLQKGTK
jgi:hypothetical protein